MNISKYDQFTISGLYTYYNIYRRDRFCSPIGIKKWSTVMARLPPAPQNLWKHLGMSNYYFSIKVEQNSSLK